MDQESAISVDRDQEPFSIGEFRPEDAEGIVRLFLEIYGEGYPIRLFYDPEAVIAANRDGEYISIVARTDSGKVIGVNFGVFTENNAANMAIPIRFAIEVLKQAGWRSPNEPQSAESQTTSSNPSANSNTSVAEKK